MTGKFIVFEGVDGAGKSTQTKLLADLIKGLGFGLVVTFEPGDTEVGKLIRQALFGCEIDPTTEALLFAADRAEHVRKVIQPALAEGKVVISDRFLLSSIVYQSHGKGLPREWVGMINKRPILDATPDLTIVFDLPVDTALKRVQNANRFENASLQEKVRKGFLDEAAKDPGKVKVVDASKDAESIHSEIAKLVLPLLMEVEK